MAAAAVGSLRYANGPKVAFDADQVCVDRRHWRTSIALRLTVPGSSAWIVGLESGDG